MEYTNFIDLVAQAINIDLATPTESETTLKNSFVWINFKGADMLCKTETYHSWCKDIAKEVRILNGFIDSNTLTIVYHLIEMQSEKKYLELYGK